MNGILKESTVVKENGFMKPLIHQIDFIYDNCFRNFHKIYFHKFEFNCANDSNFIF